MNDFTKIKEFFESKIPEKIMEMGKTKVDKGELVYNLSEEQFHFYDGEDKNMNREQLTTLLRDYNNERTLKYYRDGLFFRMFPLLLGKSKNITLIILVS